MDPADRIAFTYHGADTVRTIVNAVAEYENVQPEDLPPVEEWVPIDVRQIRG